MTWPNVAETDPLAPHASAARIIELEQCTPETYAQAFLSVCGFYASYYGKVDITREQAIAERDKWLALGQPWRRDEARV